MSKEISWKNLPAHWLAPPSIGGFFTRCLYALVDDSFLLDKVLRLYAPKFIHASKQREKLDLSFYLSL